MRYILTTYEVVTPESAECGESDSRGYIMAAGGMRCTDGEPADIGYPITGEDYDGDIIAEAVKYLRKNYATEASDYPYSPRGTWYTAPNYNHDYRTGATESRSYHLVGFTDEEERAIYEAVMAK